MAAHPSPRTSYDATLQMTNKMSAKDSSGEEMLISSNDYLSSLSREEREETVPSLRIHRYSEEETTRHLLTRFDHFYGEMMGKIRTLRSVPVLERYNDEEEEVPVGRRKEQGDSPGTSERLESIRRMEEDLRSVTEEYRTAREERMSVQREMCEEVSRNGDSRLFLDLCRFELSSSSSSSNPQRRPLLPPSAPPPQKPSQKMGKFVKRNIELAKDGNVGPYSLTDDEKLRMEDLLEEDKEEEGGSNNPFLLSRDEERRMREIDLELGTTTEELLDGMRAQLDVWSSKSESCTRSALRRIDEELERLRTEEEKTDLPEREEKEKDLMLPEEDFMEEVLLQGVVSKEASLVSDEDLEEFLRSTEETDVLEEIPKGMISQEDS